MNSTPKIFAAALTATLLAFALLIGRPARAQYYDSNGTAWNNGTSAILGTMSSGYAMREYNRRQLYRSMQRGNGPLTTKQRGTLLIESGRATLTFAARPFPLGQYMKTTWSGNGDNAVKRRNYAEWLQQDALWKAEMRARGAQTNNVADVLSVALVMAFEAATGRRVNTQGYKQVNDDFRSFFLTKAAAFQGYSAREKQEFVEGITVRVTNALRQRRAGHLEKAQNEGRAFLDSWADNKSEGALQLLTPLSSAAPAPPRVVRRASAPPLPTPAPTPTRPVASPAAPAAPQITDAQADAIVRYKPVASSVLPDVLIQATNTPAGERADTFRLYETLLDAGRNKMNAFYRASFEPIPNEQEDVSIALAYALMVFHTSVKTDSGNVSDAGWTPQNVAALSRRLTATLAGNPEFAHQSARQKQQMYETAVLLSTMVSVMNGDVKTRDRARQLARQGTQKLIGVSLDDVKLTPTDVSFE